MMHVGGIDLSIFNFSDININLLDYGSGDGFYSIFFLKKGYKVTAVDLDFESKNKILAQLNENEKKRFDFINLNAEQDSLKNYNKKFDFIICREVLEHIKNYENVISLFNNVLKKNGICIISVPTFFSEQLFYFFDKNWFKKCEHVNVFRKKDIISLAGHNDFYLEKITAHSFNRILFWSLIIPFRVDHRMGKILNRNKWINLVEFFSNAICSFKIIDKIGNLILPKSRVFYLRRK